MITISSMIKGIFQFLKSKTFFLHLTIYTLVVGLLLWIILSWLSAYTNHGESIKVPDFNGVKTAELDKIVEGQNLSYLIIDSVWDAKAKKGTVIRQEPEANAEVKEGRTIYLYITSTQPPAVQMPKLIDRSLRQAIAMIQTYGFKLDNNIKYVPDQCANCVLEQLVKGKRIQPGENVPKGTVISLVVGQGLGNEEVGIPCLQGLTRKEAMAKLAEASLNIGAIAFDNPKDTSQARVYRQIPSCSKSSSAKLGGSVDLFLTKDINKIPASVDSTGALKKNEQNFDE